MVGHKRWALSLEMKSEMIKLLERGVKNGKVCKRFGLSNSTVTTIWKNRNKLDKTGGTHSVKSLKKPKNEILDEAVLKWFKQQRNLQYCRLKPNSLSGCWGTIQFNATTGGWIVLRKDTKLILGK